MEPHALTIIHKVLRADLFELAQLLATAGPDNAGAVRTAVHTVAGALRGHAEREDGLLVVLRERAPAHADRMARDHRRLDAQIDAVCAAADALADVAPSGRAVRLHTLYLDWNTFLSGYLAHLDDEERVIFPSVPEAIPPVEFVAENLVQAPPAVASAFLERLPAQVTADEHDRIRAAYDARG